MGGSSYSDFRICTPFLFPPNASCYRRILQERFVVNPGRKTWDLFSSVSDKAGVSAGNFTARGNTRPILKQFVGDFYLENGASVHIRSFGQFNVTLWDLVMKEFGLLTERDVLVVNFGAWWASLLPRRPFFYLSRNKLSPTSQRPRFRCAHAARIKIFVSAFQAIL